MNRTRVSFSGRDHTNFPQDRTCLTVFCHGDPEQKHCLRERTRQAVGRGGGPDQGDRLSQEESVTVGSFLLLWNHPTLYVSLAILPSTALSMSDFQCFQICCRTF